MFRLTLCFWKVLEYLKQKTLHERSSEIEEKTGAIKWRRFWTYWECKGRCKGWS